MRTTVARVVAGVGMAVVALTGLGACSAQPGVAVRVGDHTYTEAQIDKVYDEIAASTGQELRRDQLVWALAGLPSVRAAATELGIDHSDAAVTELLDAQIAAGNIRKPAEGFSPQTREAITYLVIASQFRTGGFSQEQAARAAEAEKKALEQAPPEVNPRYGKGLRGAGSTDALVTFGDVVPATAGQEFLPSGEVQPN